MNRYLSIWFPHLYTDTYARQQPAYQNMLFVMTTSERGRMVIQAANQQAESEGIHVGMALADARAIFSNLTVVETATTQQQNLLLPLAEWCLRFSPDIAIDPPDGLLLNISGCPHLWGNETLYLKEIISKLQTKGYDVRAAIADSVGTAWAVARYGVAHSIIPSGKQKEALCDLPPEALRISKALAEKLHKLGLYTIGRFIDIARPTLARRFGQEILLRIDQALANAPEYLNPIRPVPPFEERLPCMEAIRSAKGIEIAIQQLLKKLCHRLFLANKGLRSAVLTCHRVDNDRQQISIHTGRASRNEAHLFQLLALKIPSLRPDLGFEMFLLEATITEKLTAVQERLWHSSEADNSAVAELLDKIAGKAGLRKIHRYLPEARYWPEYSFREAAGLQEKPAMQWPANPSRPVCLLPQPEKIAVSVPLPDYPPLLFHYKGKAFRIVKADGPERIEREWWTDEGLYRDYYCVEDESGARYWLFRSGHFDDEQSAWYLHGFFA